MLVGLLVAYAAVALVTGAVWYFWARVPVVVAVLIAAVWPCFIATLLIEASANFWTRP